jgi:formiminotetrahydrofolate cyclodeaminase
VSQNGNQDVLSLPVKQFVAATAAKTPTPGGGSVAGVVGSLAAALGEMALNFTRGKKKFAQHEAYHDRLSGRLARTRAMFQQLVADDMAAYRLYQDATRVDEGPQKTQAVQLALAAAIDVPRESAKVALALLADLKEFADKCNPYLISDLAAAAALAVSVAQLADYNVRTNVPNLADAEAGRDVREASAGDLVRAQQLLQEIEQAAKAHLP